MSLTIQRATEIIELISESPKNLTDIESHFNVHRTTVFRQLQTLEKAGFVLRRTDGTYSIGMRIISIAQQALENIDLRKVAHDEIQALQQRVGNTVHVAQLMGNSIVYVDKVETTESVRMYSRIGRAVSPQCTGVGKVILSQLSPQLRDEVLRDADWVARTPTTHTTRKSLDAELNDIMKRGWGVDDGEFETFTNCIAVPVTDSTGTIKGAISISSLKAVNDLDDLMTHLEDLLKTADNISRQLS